MLAFYLLQECVYIGIKGVVIGKGTLYQSV
jgi:hypothetical protein